MATIVNSRIQIKQSTVPSQEPTIPASNDHTDGSWLITDIYEGEFFWNIPDKKLYQRSGSSIVQIMDEDSIASILGDYYAKSETDDLLDEKLSKSIVVSSDHTAVLDEVYHNVATATYTDPSPVEGKGFKVLVINGTATVGGTGYSTAGAIIIRRYHSGSWANLVYNDKDINDSLYLSLSGGTLTGALTAPSFTINGTAGNGFMSLINQSSNPSAVSGTIRLFADSSANLTWVRRNNANSADIRRTLVMPDQNIDYTFPTPASGTASTLAGLDTAQQWTQQQTFTGTHRIQTLQIRDFTGTYATNTISSASASNITIQTPPGGILNLTANTVVASNIMQATTLVTTKGIAGISATGGPDIGSASNISTAIRIGGVFISATTYVSEYSQAGSNTNGLLLETPSQTAATGTWSSLTIRSAGQTNASNPNASSVSRGSIVMYTRDMANGLESGSIYIDTCLTTAGADGTGVKGGIVFFNRANASINWQGLQRGIFIGNATAVPTGNPTGGGFLYVEGGALKWRGSSGTVTTIATA